MDYLKNPVTNDFIIQECFLGYKFRKERKKLLQ